MQPLQVRGIGADGFVPDIPAHNLPPNAVSNMNNLQFRDGTLERSGVMRDIGWNVSALNPILLMNSRMRPDGLEESFLQVSSRAFYKVVGSTVTSLAVETAITGADATVPSTSDVLDTSVYFASRDQILRGYKANGTQVETLQKTDFVGWKWGVVRGFRGFVLVANGIDGSSVDYPTKLVWSDVVTANALATNWQVSSTSSLAGTNTLSDLGGPILDMQVLGPSTFVYGPQRVMRMDLISQGQRVFAFEPAWQSDGVLGPNLVKSVSGIGHFVVGSNQIYLTNGRDITEIASGKVERWFRRNIDLTVLQQAFVHVDSSRKQVWIVFRSKDSGATWSQANYNNRALVWDYSGPKPIWFPMDLPNVTAGASLYHQPDALTYDGASTLGLTYNSSRSSYVGAAGTKSRFQMFVSGASTPYVWTQKVGTYDDFEGGASSAEALRPSSEAFVERIGLDMDEIGAPLKGLKYLTTMTPQLGYSHVPVTFEIGTSNQPDYGVTWNPPVDYDQSTDDEIPIDLGGKYLAYRASVNDAKYQLKLGGFDVEVDVLSEYA